MSRNAPHRALIGTVEGKLRVFDLGTRYLDQAGSAVGAPSDIAEKFTLDVGANPTSIAYFKEKAAFGKNGSLLYGREGSEERYWWALSREERKATLFQFDATMSSAKPIRVMTMDSAHRRPHRHRGQRQPRHREPHPERGRLQADASTTHLWPDVMWTYDAKGAVHQARPLRPPTTGQFEYAGAHKLPGNPSSSASPTSTDGPGCCLSMRSPGLAPIRTLHFLEPMKAPTRSAAAPATPDAHALARPAMGLNRPGAAVSGSPPRACARRLCWRPARTSGARAGAAATPAPSRWRPCSPAASTTAASWKPAGAASIARASSSASPRPTWRTSNREGTCWRPRSAGWPPPAPTSSSPMAGRTTRPAPTSPPRFPRVRFVVTQGAVAAPTWPATTCCRRSRPTWPACWRR